MNKEIVPELAGNNDHGFKNEKAAHDSGLPAKAIVEAVRRENRRPIRAARADFNNFQGASNEIARHINSRVLLNLVREHQPISRADLMRRSGLQRSTISVITEQLITNNWLREGNLGESIRGRRPTFLHINENRLGVLGIDLQQASTHIGLADLNGRLVVRETLPTATDFDRFVPQIGNTIHNWMGQFPFMQFQEIGLSLPGPINPSSHQFLLGPNVRWSAADLKNQLEETTGLNVCIETTANACALSESWFNERTKHSRNIVVVAVSDRIGTGIIINGQLVRGKSALAGGFGHVIINENGPLCTCGNRGCWETLASNSAAIRYYNGLCAPRHRVKRFDDLLRLADQNDSNAIEALNQMAESLGAGIAMLVSGFAPDFVSITGEITGCWNKVEPVIRKAVQKRVFRSAAVNIIAGRSQPPPGLQGVIALVLHNHFASPIKT